MTTNAPRPRPIVLTEGKAKGQMKSYNNQRVINTPPPPPPPPPVHKSCCCNCHKSYKHK